MIRAGSLSREDRADLIALARDSSAAHRLARRANALVLLDDGWSCERVAAALLLDDDTIRRWHGLFLEDGLEGLTRFESGGGALNSAAELSGVERSLLSITSSRTSSLAVPAFAVGSPASRSNHTPIETNKAWNQVRWWSKACLSCGSC